VGNVLIWKSVKSAADNSQKVQMVNLFIIVCDHAISARSFDGKPK